MSTVLSMVSLRWALTLGTLKKSSWQLVGAILSVIIGCSALTGCWSVTLATGTRMAGAGAGAGADEIRMVGVVMVILQALISLMTIIVQILLVGQGSNMDLRRFELYGIRDGQLQVGLFLAALTGPMSIFGLIGFLAMVPIYRGYGPGVSLAALLGSCLGLIVLLALSRMVVDLATTLVNSQRARNGFYLMVTLLFVMVCFLPAMLTSRDSLDGFDLHSLIPAARILAWTPLGAAFQLPQDILASAWLPFLGRVLIELVTLALCYLVGIWCLRHSRLHQGHEMEQKRSSNTLSAFRGVPDSPAGAIAARLLIYMRRDTRKVMFLIFPVLFMIVFAFEATSVPFIIWFAPLMGGVMMMAAEANALAYDGKGLSMEVMAGVRGSDDRRGRAWTMVPFSLVYMLVLSLICIPVSGYWKNLSDGMGAVDLTCLSFAVVLSGFGVAQIVSALLIYPVPSLDRPFASPQGRAISQLFMLFAQFLSHFLTMLPTLVVAIAVSVAGSRGLLWIIAPVALVNGLIVYAVGIRWGGSLFDRRQLSIIRTLDGLATLQV